jgi:hypothetical protein
LYSRVAISTPSAAAIAVRRRTTAGRRDRRRCLRCSPAGRRGPRRGRARTPGGGSRAAARRRLVLCDPRRRLPDLPKIVSAGYTLIGSRCAWISTSHPSTSPPAGSEACQLMPWSRRSIVGGQIDDGRSHRRSWVSPEMRLPVTVTLRSWRPPSTQWRRRARSTRRS